MQKSIKHSKIFLIIIFSFFIGTAFDIQQCSGEISVDSYCQLTIKLIKQQISNYQELIAIAKQHKNKRKTFNNMEKTKRAEFRKADESLFSSSGTTAKEYVNYMSKHARAVSAYLKAHPDIKQQIDKLAARRNTLLEQYESLNRR